MGILVESGHKLSEQVNITGSAHSLQGYVYTIEGDEDTYLFSQVGYSEFTFVNLISGNRLVDPVKSTSPDDGDEVLSILLGKIRKAGFEDITCRGKFRDFILEEVE